MSLGARLGGFTGVGPKDSVCEYSVGFIEWGVVDMFCIYFDAQLGIDTVPVLVGPVTYLLLSKGDKSAPKGFDTLSLLDAILPVYK